MPELLLNRHSASGNRLPLILALLGGLAMLVRLVMCVDVFSPTIDEPAHIGGAVAAYEDARIVAEAAHPPLAHWVAGIPLYLDQVRLPQCRGITRVQREDVAYAWGTQVLYDSAKPVRTILRHARLAMLIFPALALLYVYLLTRDLAGAWPAAAAVIFFSTDPTLLGHGIWVGTDVAATAGFLAGIFYFMRWLDQPTPLRAAVAGLATGVAIAAKFSCVLLVPAMVILLLIRFRSRSAARMAGHAMIAILVGFFALWGTYLFRIGALGNQNVLGHPPAWEHLPAWILRTPLPMPSFFLGMAYQAGQNQLGHMAYLNGHFSNKGWWYYFPEMLVIKSPVGFIVALVIALSLWLFSRAKFGRAIQATLIPAAVFLLIGMSGHIDIGVRHILPAIALLYVFCAIQLSRPGLRALLGILIVMSLMETAWVHPDYLSFFNVLAGGSIGGQRLAADSNLDWGQDEYRLADWIKTHNVNDYAIRLCGYRNKPELIALGIDATAMDKPVHGRVVFLDVNMRLLENRLSWLAQYKPIARIGTSIEVYDLRGKLDLPDQPDDPPHADVPATQP